MLGKDEDGKWDFESPKPAGFLGNWNASAAALIEDIAGLCPWDIHLARWRRPKSNLNLRGITANLAPSISLARKMRLFVYIRTFVHRLLKGPF